MSYFQTKFWSTTHKHFLYLFAEYWVFSGPRVVVSLSLMGNILKTTFLFDGMVAYIKVSASSKCKVWNCKWFYNFALYISLYALILRSSGMVGVLYKKRQGGFQFGIWNVSVFLGGISSDFVCEMKQNSPSILFLTKGTYSWQRKTLVYGKVLLFLKIFDKNQLW